MEAAARLTSWLLGCVASESVGRLRDLAAPASQKASRRGLRRERQLHGLIDQMGRLKGAFAKAGQFASLRVDLASPALRASLTRLQQDVPPLPLSDIAPLVEAELGAPLGRLFARFEAEPLGAASIAQVHRATLPDGRSVAVKVQYPWLQDALESDLRILGAALRIATRATGKELPDRERVMAEFAAGLRDELDFEREARVAAQIAENLAGDSQVVVPAVVESHSRRRVLTMSYVDAVSITDHPGLEALGVETSAVLEILTRAYAKQVFVDGLFHADPHPGNLFVVAEPGASTRPRLLFVDFGLSKRLGLELRRELRTGIYALLQRDLDAFIEGMDRLGMIAPGARPAVAAAVSGMFERIAQTGGALAVGGSQLLALKDHAKQLLAETPGLQLPSDLLLYAKTVTYLFGLGELLAPEVDLMKIALPSLLKFLAAKD